MEVSGVLRQAAIFGESFHVMRTIRCYLRRNCIELHDVIENRAFEAQPLMVMYHCNFGYPLLSEHAQLQLHAAETKPRDVVASGDLTQIQPPASGFAEQVFYHKGADCAVLRNVDFGVRLSWDAGALPCLTQWNMFGAGDYVMGLEPGNCHPVGRQAYLASPDAEYLQSEQKKVNTLSFEIVL